MLSSYTSPRLRARQTIECLSLGNIGDNLPWVRTIPSTEEMLPHQGASSSASVHMSDDLQEWNYGDYEGLDIAQVRSKRRARGQSEAWNIWQDGCEGGEYVLLEPGCGLRLIALVSPIDRLLKLPYGLTVLLRTSRSSLWRIARPMAHRT